MLMVTEFQRVMTFFCVAIFLLVLLSCSNDPLSPSDDGNQVNVKTSSAEGSGHSLLGFYLLEIDPETSDINFIPVRSAELHLNVTGILNATMGISAVGVPAEHDPPNGLFVFDVTLTHPLAAKPQLAGFDVKGILMAPGSVDVGGLMFAGIDETRLENADGYTRWWNPSEFTDPGMFGYVKGKLAVGSTGLLTANVNPYKLFADRLGPNDSLSWIVSEPLDSDMGRAVFTAGAENTRRYKIRFKMNPGPQILYGYAIDASWAPPSPNPPSAVPDDFPMNANQPEAYRLGVTEKINSLYYDSESGTGGGALELDISVYDWQGQASGDFSGEITNVKLYCPELGVDGLLATDQGQDAYKRKYKGQMNNLGSNPFYRAQVFCAALSLDGSTYKQTADAGPDVVLEAWNSIIADAVDPECASDSNNSIGEAVALVDGEPVVESLCGSSDTVDYYKFEVPFGKYFNGKLQLHCNIPGSSFEITNENGTVLMTDSLNGWYYTGLAGKKLTSGTYYLKIETTSSGIAGLYVVSAELVYDTIVPNTPVEVTPPNLSCDAKWVYVYGDYLFAVGDHFTWAYDISNQNSPVFLSRSEVISSIKPAFSYPYMYLAQNSNGDGELNLIDFTDVSNPVVSDVGAFGPEYKFIQMDSNVIYLAYDAGGGNQRCSIIDYSMNPLMPTYKSLINIEDSTIRNMEIIYPGTTNESLIVCESLSTAAYNVYDKLNPYLVDSVSTADTNLNIFMTTRGEYIITVKYNDIANLYNLLVYRYTGGSSIDYLGFISLPEFSIVTALEAYGNWIIVGLHHNLDIIYQIYDFSDPGNITLESEFQTYSWVTDIHHDQDTIALTQKYNVPIFADITGGGIPATWYATCSAVNYPTNSVIIDDCMYLLNNKTPSYYKSGIDITDPPNAFTKYKWDQGSATGLLSGTDRVILNDRGGNQLYWSTPNHGVWGNSGFENLGQTIASVTASDNYIYAVLQPPAVMKVWSLDTWPIIDPQPLADVAIGLSVHHLSVHGDVMYAFFFNEIFIYDLTEPNAPVHADSYFVSDSMENLLIFGDWMYLIGANKLIPVDISNPLIPVSTTSVSLPYPGMRYITRIEQFLIIGDMNHHPVFYDISDPISPVLYGEPITDDPIWPIRGLDSNGGFLYELCDSYGVRIYQLF